MTASHPIDAAARDRALDTRRSIVLQAPAGSGKTTILTQRFLALLAEVDEPESILAVTFTRKAAAEMRARLLDALTRGRNPAIIANDAADARTLELARAALMHGQRRGWTLLETPTRLRVMTIDGLNRSIAAGLPLLSWGTGTLEISQQPARLYREAARRALEDAESDTTLQALSGRVFDRLDNRWDRLEALLARMLANRSQWLRHLTGQPPEVLRAAIEAQLIQLVGEAILALEQAFSTTWLEEGGRLARAAVLELERSKKDPQLERELRCVATGRRDGELDERLAWWQGLSHLALTRSGSRRKSVTVKHGFPPGSAEQRALKADMLAWLEELEVDSATASLLMASRELPTTRWSIEDAEAFDALVYLLRYTAAQLVVHSQTSGQVDYVAIAAAARAALNDPELGSEQLVHQGARLEHILVDEFQDTSIDQFELLKALTADWSAGDGRTMFVVGDPMQSIYQFREAEVGLFTQARDRGLGQIRFESLALQCNFRSQAPLVEFSNTVFARVFPSQDLPREAGVRHLPSVAAATRVPAVPVGVHLQALDCGPDGATDRQREARSVLRIVQQAQAANREVSIAVLVSARSHATTIVETLRAAGVAVQGVDLVPLAERPVVQDLLALTRSLRSLADRIAWLALLRAPWCGLTLEELAWAVEGQPGRTVIESLRDEQRRSGWPSSMRERIDRLLEICDVGRQQCHLALADRVERLWWQLGGPSAYPDASSIDDARLFFDALAASESAGRLGNTEIESETLESVLDELFAASDSSPAAVQVMTIHRAKGLEFDVVILPGLQRRPRSDEPELLDWVEWSERDGESVLLIAPIRAPDSETPTALGRWIRRLRSRRTERERARLMYVAMTRARSALHLLATVSRDDDGIVTPAPITPLGILWPALRENFASLSRSVDEPNDSEGVELPGLSRLPRHWQPPPIPADVTFEFLPLTSGELLVDTAHTDDIEIASRFGGDDTARRIGVVLHRELERLARLDTLPNASEFEGSIERWHVLLRAEGVSESMLVSASERLREGILRTLEDPKGRWILTRRGADDGVEWPLTGRYEGRWVSIVIDRAFVDEAGQRWIIDYKSSAPEVGESRASFLQTQRERYAAQLHRYADFVARLEDRPVRAALYFPMLAEFVELDLTSAR